MFTQFRNWSIKAKIMSILLLSICVIAVAVEVIIVPIMQSYFMNERQIATRQVVEVVYGILDTQAMRAQAGQESTVEAQSRAVSLIKSLRFSGKEYFWIHDLNRPVPRMIMHPTVPALDGKVLDDPQFNKATGKRTRSESSMVKLDNKNLFAAMNEIAEAAGEGFVAYSWPKPTVNGRVTAELYPKISFVKKHVAWGWVVGSGIYVDDVKTAVAHVRRLLHTASILFCLAAIIIYYLMVRYISKPVISIASLAKRIATGDYGAQLPVTTHDEVGLLSESLNQMSNQVQQKTLDLEAANKDLQLELAERRRAEESLKASEEKFRTLVNNSFDVIFVLDAAGVFRFASPSWEAHFGYPVTGVIEEQFQTFVHPDDVSHCLDYLQQVMTSNYASTCLPYRVKHANGSWRLFIANGTRHTDSTGTPLYIGIGRDITDEKKLEEERLNLERQFLHAQKLESLGIMAGGIAHDFNNLLAVIIGNLELLLGMQAGKESPTTTRIERAMQASLKAADLTRQMLAYTGKGIFELKQLDLNQLVKENCDLFRLTVPKNITMKTELHTPLPFVLGDAGQLQQVIMNLITNTSEAVGSDPGNILIATGVQQCDQKLLGYSRLDEKPEPGRFIYIDVTDSGCGMDKETQQRIFEPFFTTKFTGRGLGMASVMGIVKAHKGAILLYSEPGLGSTFKVLLPISAESGNHALSFPAQELELYRIPKGMVLVADDEEYVREVSREYLSELGLVSLSAANGREAVDIFRRHQQDIPLIILDLTMPELDGVATLRELRLIKPDIKVIVSSGHAPQASANNFSTDMPDGFIQKPFQLQELREIIGNLFKDHQHAS